ncbi:MAG: tryptophan synthase subunit beta, tryptophan synthase beta chain [Candidatus Peregrinibacteria bacterium GW2011_GWF2_39_17]|nr:MAG: tryptophan synthase subunit beta, tryptophan synthase beta chain [Candidatus Peregrinibacteria bacterium GW2011_GWF2_39_17]HCW32806.1 tryptophan synthase subunit beta [Candidatus Peregrinibacteria bacterium]
MQSLGHFGKFGGIFVSELLMPALEELEAGYLKYRQDPNFKKELKKLLTDYAGRPTPLYFAQNLSKQLGAKIYLKREDLLHGGAHKTNNTLGQGLLAKMMGKKELLAETGAGQHGFATAMIGALLGLKVKIFMGSKDVERQHVNVLRMQMCGAEVIPINFGSQTLKDALNEALRYWVANSQNTAYVLGTVAGPHPYPSMVRDFQKIIGIEAKRQLKKSKNQLPTHVVACVGGGSNAMGIFWPFIPLKKIKLIGVEPAGEGLNTEKHGATLTKGSPGCLHGSLSYVLQDKDGQIKEAHSISAGLDYPGVGPEHAFLKESNRADYVSVTDKEALEAMQNLAKIEGIIPALESAHALAYLPKLIKNLGPKTKKEACILVNISGRGDKDMEYVSRFLTFENPTI